MKMISEYILDYIKWALPIRYKLHLMLCGLYGQESISYPAWERLMRRCNYTLFRALTNYKFVQK